MNLSLLTGRKNALFSMSCMQINGDGTLLQVITVASHSCNNCATQSETFEKVVNTLYMSVLVMARDAMKCTSALTVHMFQKC